MTSGPTDSEETRRLLDQAAAGAPGAFDRLLGRHGPYLRQFIELRLDRRVRARVDPSDVVQEAQLEAHQRIADYLERRPMPFRLWLRQTAFERLLKVHRHHLGAARRAAGREVALPDASSVALAAGLAGPAPSRVAERAELATRVRAAIDALSAADQEVLILRDFEGLSNSEISFLLGLDAGAVSKRHGRALLRLRKVLLEGGLAGSGHE